MVQFNPSLIFSAMRRLQLVSAELLDQLFRDLDSRGVQRLIGTREPLPLAKDPVKHEPSIVFFVHYFKRGEIDNSQPRYNLIEESPNGDHRIVMHGPASDLRMCGEQITLRVFPGENMYPGADFICVQPIIPQPAEAE